MTNKFYIKSKAKTFKKNINWVDLLDWFHNNIELNPDPELNYKTAKKYVITIKEVR